MPPQPRALRSGSAAHGRARRPREGRVVTVFSRQGRRRQDHDLDQPRRRTWPRTGPPGCCSSTSTSRSATSRSASQLAARSGSMRRRRRHERAPRRAGRSRPSSPSTSQRARRHRARRPTRPTPSGSPAHVVIELLRVARRHVRLRHRRHAAGVHRARAGGLRRQRPARSSSPRWTSRRSRTCASTIDTLDMLGHARGQPGHRAQPLRRQGRAHAPTTSTAALKHADRGAGAEQPGRAGVGQPRRADRPRRAAGTRVSSAIAASWPDHATIRAPVRRGPSPDAARTAPASRLLRRSESMSLADRLDSARRSQRAGAPTTAETRRPAAQAPRRRPVRRGQGQRAPGAVEQLGPAALRPAPASRPSSSSRCGTTLQEVIDSEQTPLSHADRTRIAQEVSDEILGHGPLEPLLRDPEVTEIMVNGPRPDLRRARRQDLPGRRARSPSDAAPAPHHRQDRRPGRPARRRGQPDGRRPPARRLPRQRRHPADRARRLAC